MKAATRTTITVPGLGRVTYAAGETVPQQHRKYFPQPKPAAQPAPPAKPQAEAKEKSK